MSDRWNDWLKRSRTCYRAAASVDNAKTALHAALLDIKTERPDVPPAGTEPDHLEQARQELMAAERALFGAREHLQAALKDKALTPKNREPEFWSAS